MMSVNAFLNSPGMKGVHDQTRDEVTNHGLAKVDTEFDDGLYSEYEEYDKEQF
jgi:hypothetical protein